MLQSEPRSSLCAVAFTAIEADLEAFSPGRMAAHDGHGRLAEGKRAQVFFLRERGDFDPGGVAALVVLPETNAPREKSATDNRE